ncbi:MAG: HD domain-containing phosphohydrolase [Chloroflexaceae bacterium]
MRGCIQDTTSAHPPARLLIVDDDTNVRNFCARLLRHHGYATATADNGRTAVEMLREKRYDLVLTDLQMPEMGGIELLHYLREQHPDVDKLVFTAFAEVDTARQALKLGAFDYLTKPVDADDLERAVRRCLELRRIRQEKERLSELVVMYQFSQAIANSLDVETQVMRINAFLWQRFAPDSLSVSLLYPEDQCLRLLTYKTRHSSGPRADQLPLAPDCSEEQLVQVHMQLIGGRGTNVAGLMAGAVLRTNDRPVGCLHLTRNGEQPEFDANERKLLSVFALQIAASLDNARLYQRLREQNLQTIEALAAAIDARDPYTHGHSEQVTRYAVRLAEVIGLPAERIERLRYAGLLHDIGKIGIRDHILLKPSPLSDEEFDIMKEHPSIGANIIRGVQALSDTLPIIEGHHERIDGSGYPGGLSGEQLSLETRILAVADAFDAMTSNRAYRAGMDTATALNILRKGRGTEWDAQLVDAFVDLIHAEGADLRTKVKLPPPQEAVVTTPEYALALA